jgi:hypothetical protein
MGDWLGWIEASSSSGCEVLVAFAALSDLDTVVCLGTVATLGVDFALAVIETFKVGAMNGSGWDRISLDSLDNTAPTDHVITTSTQDLLLSVRFCTFRI